MTAPQLAKAIDLEHWADEIDARSDFPELIRRLVLATAAPTEIEFRAQEGTDYEGWDGRVKTKEDSPHVPTGASGWEMGVGQNPRQKAQDDYKKRTKSPDPFTPSRDSFVFCTPRKWSNKDDWVSKKRKEGPWSDVKAYDADDIATWLSNAPGVHVWLSLQLGMPVDRVEDLNSWWQYWRAATNPTLSSRLLLSGRSSVQEELAERLRGEPAIIMIKGDSSEEVQAFVAATIDSAEETERGGLFARALLVEDKTAWRYFAAQKQSLVLIPTFDDRTLFISAVQSGHHVILPVGAAYRQDVDLNVPRLSAMAAKDHFEKEGLSSAEARHQAGLLRRSLPAFRRVNANVPPSEPNWASGSDGPPLAPLVLLGEWDEGHGGDREATQQLTGRTYEEVRATLNQWRGAEDAPFRQVGSQWRVNAKEDAWRTLSRYASRDTIKRFASLATDALTEKNPRRALSDGEQLMPHPDSPKRKRSGALRSGIADTIGMLGTLGEGRGGPELSDGTDTAVYATKVVRAALEAALSDQDLWHDLAPHLPSLAEAAPDVFVDVLEQDLASREPTVLSLFDPRPGLLSPSYDFPKLLWAAEGLAWSPAHFTRVAALLASLAAVAPDAEIVNSPEGSLLSFFRLWLPQCGAPLDQRLAALDHIRESYPDVAWGLMCGLLPSIHDSATISSGPGARAVLWREWSSEAERPTPEEHWKSVQEICGRVAEDVGASGPRWLALIGYLQGFPADVRSRLLDDLEAFAQSEEGADWRAALREQLREMTSRHRAHPDMKWAMSRPLLERFEEVAASLATSDPRIDKQWLFGNHPNLPVDIDSHREELGRWRRSVVQEIVSMGDGGLDELLSFAGKVEVPEYVGATYARIEPNEQDVEAVLDLLGQSGTVQDFAKGFVAEASRDPTWRGSHLNAATLSKWDASKRVAALLQLPTSNELIDLVESIGGHTASLFWKSKNGFWSDDTSLAERAIRAWIEHRRPRRAIRHLSMRSYGDDFVVDTSVVEDALAEGLRVPVEEDPTRLRVYDIERLLTYLRAASEVADEVLEGLEWAYLPTLEPKHTQLRLHERLSEDPAFFVEVVGYAFKRDGAQKSSRDNLEATKRALQLLDSWRSVPGFSQEQGVLSEEHLRTWLRQSTDLLKEADLMQGGYIAIGQMLRWGPDEKDGLWPAPAICSVIEDLSSDIVDSNFRIALFNSRGATVRGPFAGGDQERALTEKYEGYAKKLESRWPRVAAILRGLASTYKSDARRRDREAERDEDDFG